MPQEDSTPTTPTPTDALRAMIPPNILAQFPIHHPAAMAQFLQAQVSQPGLVFPGVPGGIPMFPPGIPADFKPEMLMAGGGPTHIPLFAAHGLYHPYAMDGMKKRNATREATAPLKNWLHEHKKNPYPSKQEKVTLAVLTQMTLTQVSTWFANARRRLKKENKMTWSPQNRRGDGCDEDDDDFDDDMLNRPSSSTSINSKGESLFGKALMASPTPSGGSSDDLTTPKKEQISPIPTDDSESPKRKPKMWSIADVTSDDDSSKKDSSPPSSDENQTGFLQSVMMKKQMEMMARINPALFLQLMQHQSLSFMAPQTTPPNEAGEKTVKVSRSELSSGNINSITSVFSDILASIPPRVETPVC